MVRLKRSDPARPGIRRRRSGRGFSYRDADGRPLAPEERERVRQLAIPPAWRDVWICPFPNGHIQATGTDGAGRLQYIYHPLWRERQDAEKFQRAARLGLALPKLRAMVARHLREAASPKTRTLAAAVRLMDRGALRIGDESYRKQNGSHGLTTLRCRHVSIDGNMVHLRFPGKSGQRFECSFADARLAAFLEPLAARAPREPLLAFELDSGRFALEAGMLNDYIRRCAGDGFTAKDFRTWKGTVTAALSLIRASSDTPPRAALAQAFEDAAALLGNTVAVARDAYVDPRVIAAFQDGTLRTLPPREAAVAQFLTDKAS
ncbi:DNA topoisomerase [Arthrobacter sp. SW1]|uniref:DNA topoisomerase IB n=1 Tax=Arthrobacter sp. SW1 TaxID=1920889 RepID=UPI000877D053|nr:DNA topoisomerase IB [Arthrobacter sp. SW1]OFI38103.1 DNA topoisomerase [Arthrobacter sp. SW1]